MSNVLIARNFDFFGGYWWLLLFTTKYKRFNVHEII